MFLATRLGLSWSVPFSYILEAVQGGQWIASPKAGRELGLSPRPLVETMADTVAWFQRHGYLQRPLRSIVQ